MNAYICAVDKLFNIQGIRDKHATSAVYFPVVVRIGWELLNGTVFIDERWPAVSIVYCYDFKPNALALHMPLNSTNNTSPFVFHFMFP